MSASLLPASVAASTDPRDVPPARPARSARSAPWARSLPPLRPALLAHVAWWALATTVIVLGLLSAVRALGWAVDLDVYLRGGAAVAHGEDLYAVTVHDLRFTYPPFAALLAVPLAALPRTLAQVAFATADAVAYAAVMVVVGRRCALTGRVVASLALLGLCLEPVRRSILLGQVNPLILALVVVDLLLLPRGRAGVLVGVAAGIKIVPGLFAVWFLLRRDWRGLANAVVAFLVTAVLGAVAAPEASRWYWLEGGLTALDKFDRWHVLAVDNQSLSATVDRFLRAGSLPVAVTVVCGAAAVAAAVLVARRALRRGDEVVALLALALGAVLASPVSWTHHWLWLAPTLLLLVARRRALLAAVVAGVTLVGPMWQLPLEPWAPLHYTAWQSAVGASYALLGVVLLATLWRTSRPTPGARGAAPSQGVEDAAAPVWHTGGARPGRTGILLLARRGRRDRGVAAVEAAIVLPILFVLLFGIIEFGFVFRDDISITTAIRSGTRYASIGKTGDPSFPAGAVTQVANGLTGVNMSGFQSMWVYDASTSVTPPAACGTSTCLSYPWDNTTRTFGTPTGSWNPCASATTTNGRVALYIAVKHTALTGLVPASPTISDKAVFAFEPGACS